MVKKFLTWKNGFFIVSILLAVSLVFLSYYFVSLSDYRKAVSQKEEKVQEYKGNYEHAQKLYEDTLKLYQALQSQVDSVSYNSKPDNFTFDVAKVGSKVYLRWRNKIFDSENYHLGSKEIGLENQNKISWQKILDLPKETDTSILFLYQFKNLPDGSFAFITRKSGDNNTKDINKVYYYNWTSKKLVDLSPYLPKIKDHNFPLIKESSLKGKFVLIYMLPCTECDAGYKEYVLVNLNNFQTKLIGKVSYFKWVGDEGNYEYKEFIPKTGCNHPGECYEDPDNLPLKTGSF